MLLKGSEDSHARALWAVGTALGRSGNQGFRSISALLFQRALGPVKHFSSPRAWAFTLIAIDEYLRALAGDRAVARMRQLLVTRLIDLFRANSAPDWLWFESIATYDNAKLPHALIVSGQYFQQQRRTVDIVGERADLIKGTGIRHQTIPRHAPVARLEPSHVAERGRLAN